MLNGPSCLVQHTVLHTVDYSSIPENHWQTRQKSAVGKKHVLYLGLATAFYLLYDTARRAILSSINKNVDRWKETKRCRRSSPAVNRASLTTWRNTRPYCSCSAKSI